jgi:hypothetical protein
MTHVTEVRQTDQRIKLYLLTIVLQDATFELPRWWTIWKDPVS